MSAGAKLFGHPIHQMLIVFPLGLLATAVVFDIGYLAGFTRLAEISFWLIGAGVVGGLLAAPFGLIDWLGIPTGTRAKGVGALHGLGNLAVVILFALSWFLRRGHPLLPGTGAFILSFLGGSLSLITAWLGGELVDRLGVGVDPGAHVNAPSSLSGRPAA